MDLTTRQKMLAECWQLIGYRERISEITGNEVPDMFSSRTTIAIQLIRALRDGGSRGLNTEELKIKIRIDTGVNPTVRLLEEAGWVAYGSGNRYRLVIDPEQRTLHDLMMAIDGEIRLAARIVLPHGEAERIPARSGKVNIDKIKISELINESVTQTSNAYEMTMSEYDG